MNLIILIGLIAFIVGMIVGIYIGYIMKINDQVEDEGKVAKMTWSETLRKYQESEKR